MTIADVEFREYFTKEALEKLRAAFNRADADGGGSISTDELCATFRRVGRNMTKQQVRELVKSVDYDDNGEVDFEEFCVLEILLGGLRPHVNLINFREYLTESAIQQIERGFVREDLEHSGAIGLNAAVRICTELSPNVTREDVVDVFKEADRENLGEVDFVSVCSIYAVAAKKRRKCNYREYLTFEQVSKFRKVFAQSANELGNCSFSDLEKLLRRLGMHIKQKQIQWLMHNFDTDGSGDIDFEEFCIMLLRLKGAKRQRVISPKTCNCLDLWRSEGFTVKELQECGFRIQHFKDIGIPVAKLIGEGGLTGLDLRKAGYTPQELRRSGVSASDLRRSGFSLTDLRLAGFSPVVLQGADRELKGSMSAGDLSMLAQQRPPSSNFSGRPVRGAVLSSAGAAALQTTAPCPWQLPPRPMTQMIREHTDWQPKLSRIASGRAADMLFGEPRRPSRGFPAPDWKPSLFPLESE